MNIPISVQHWTRDELLDTLAELYTEAGFNVDRSDSLPDAVALVARHRVPFSGHDIAIGVVADDEVPVVFRGEVREFCQSFALCGCARGEIITTGHFESAAVEVAQSYPVRLVDCKGLQAVMNQRSPEQDPVRNRTVHVNPIALEVARAKMANDHQRLGGYRVPPPPTVRKLEPPTEEQRQVLQVDTHKIPAHVRVSQAGISERQLIVLLTAGALAGFALVFGTFYPHTSIEAADTLKTALHTEDQPPIENVPLVPERENAPSGYVAISGGNSGDSKFEAMAPGTETVWTLHKKLVHRMELLEDLKKREEFEPLAAELLEFVKAAKELGVDYTGMGAFQLDKVIKFASEAKGMEGLMSTNSRRLVPPRLTEADQKGIMPYLRIANFELKLNLKPLAVDQLLEENNLSGFDSLRYEDALQKLERRLWAEEEIEARRHAQAIQAIVRAGMVAGVDLVKDCDGDLDLLIVSLARGRIINDPSSPFNGQTFKVYAPEPEDLGVVKRFLEIRNGRLFYHERLDDLDLPPMLPREVSEESARDAIAKAEELVRHTARQILVNGGLSQRSLIPVAGYQRKSVASNRG